MRVYLLAGMALCLIVLLILYLWEWRQRAKIAPGSFQDWVKNPQYRREVSKLLDAKKSMTVPEDVSDEEIRAMVDRLFVPEDAHLTTHLLKQIEAKATPRLLATLDEERTYSTTFPFEYRFLQPQSPFECICDVLVELAPPRSGCAAAAIRAASERPLPQACRPGTGCDRHRRAYRPDLGPDCR
ncbi:hypothetical protein [Maioricimonas rarisocia]|uniref:hypothetical protein n=1 Tax=Maioricimonas rarisocia TaxID=2528026 RepID=UPI001E54F52A|nr:hypothetical protein [Maioricimonas rarisocia]